MNLNLFRLCAVALLAAPLAHSAAHGQTPSSPVAPQRPAIAKAYGKLPLRFEPNRGQTDAAVKFLAHGTGYTTLLEPAQATLVLHRSEKKTAQGKPLAVSAEVLRMRLVGAANDAAVSGEKALPGYVNYLSGSDKSKWQVGMPTYAATRVTSAYPGIDLVYYGAERQLEYDFVIAANADPTRIRLAIDGAHPVLDASGALRLQVAAKAASSDVTFRKPVLYQQIGGERKPVEGAWQVAANREVSFRIGAYDRSHELVIDPLITYASYFGGSAEDEINGSALNASNQLYAVGQTFSPTLPSGTGEFQPSRSSVKNSNYHDGFVTKFSADGSTVLWTTYLAGSQDDFATAVAVNSSDQAYVVGYTQSCGADNSIPGVASNTAVRFPFTSDAIQSLCSPVNNGAGNAEINGGSYDAYLVKLSSDGKTELYGTPLGGSQNEVANSIVLDAAGRPYIVGETFSTQYYKCAAIGPHCGDIPAYPYDNHGNPDIGTSNYPTTSNAFYSNVAESIQYSTTDTNGNTGGPQDEQAFLTVLSADLHSFVYSSLIGGGVIGGCGNGACNTNGIAIAINAAGQAYIGGNTSSAHWPTTAGAFAPTCSNAGNSNSQCPMTGWLAGFDPSKSGTASLLFSTYMTGSSGGTNSGNPLYPSSDVFGLAVDSKGNVVATGDTYANNFPTTAGVFQPACFLSGDGNGDSNVCANAFITKLTPAGATVWSTYFHSTTAFGAGEFIKGQGVALDAKDNVYIAGWSNANNLPFQSALVANPNNTDAFLLEMNSTASSVVMGTFLGTGGGVNVDTNSLHLDSNLNAYFSGYQGQNPYGGTYFPITGNAADQTIQGNDGWVVRVATQPQTSTTSLTISPVNTSPNTPITFTAAVTGFAGANVPTGTVALTSGTTTLGTITLANGTGTYTSATIPGGTYSVVGTYSADVSYAASASAAQTLAITLTPTIALTATPATASFGTAIALKATVAATSGTTSVTPTGTVYFMDGATTLGSSVLSGGVATYSATTLAVGAHSITARYGGDGTYTVLGSSAQTVTITTITPTVALTATPSTTTIGTAVALGATIGGTGATPTGSVKFLDGTTLLSTITLTGTGTASYSATALAIGTHSITASYSGDANFAALASAAQTVTINGVTPAVLLSSTPSTATVGTAIAFGVTVSSASGTPTGTVKLLDGSTLLSTLTLSSGTASYSATALAVGAHSITAVYSGDATFAAITSAAQTVTINAIPATVSLVASPTTITIKSGATGTTTITVTPAGGYTGTLTFACGTLPTAASCSFAQPSLLFTGGATAQTSVLTINTTQAHAQLERPIGRELPVTAFAALLLLPLAFRKRSRQLIRNWKAMSLVAVLGLFGMLALSGCSSNGTFSSTTLTPTGTYTVPVTVTGGTATNSLSLSITVN